MVAINQTRTVCPAFCLGLLALSAVLPAAPPQAALQRIGVEHGICVVSGCPAAEARFVTDLAAGSRWLVYFQSPSPKQESAVRRAAEAAGLLGKRIFADRGPWPQSIWPTTWPGPCGSRPPRS